MSIVKMIIITIFIVCNGVIHAKNCLTGGLIFFAQGDMLGGYTEFKQMQPLFKFLDIEHGLGIGFARRAERPYYFSSNEVPEQRYLKMLQTVFYSAGLRPCIRFPYGYFSLLGGGGLRYLSYFTQIAGRDTWDGVSEKIIYSYHMYEREKGINAGFYLGAECGIRIKNFSAGPYMTLNFYNKLTSATLIGIRFQSRKQ